MPTEPEPLTLSQVVHRAVEIVDPDGGEGLDDLLTRFEDADDPLSSTVAITLTTPDTRCSRASAG